MTTFFSFIIIVSTFFVFTFMITLFSVIFIALAVALVWQAFDYIGRGLGGVVPYLIVVGGPAIAAYYVWYFNLRNFDAEQPGQTPST